MTSTGTSPHGLRVSHTFAAASSRVGALTVTVSGCASGGRARAALTSEAPFSGLLGSTFTLVSAGAPERPVGPANGGGGQKHTTPPRPPPHAPPTDPLPHP